MMPAYCDVDGVPCHASHELLTTILRDEWGFDGIVASDYIGVADARTAHRLTVDAATAAALALAAGVDLELPRTAEFGEPLLTRAGGRPGRRRPPRPRRRPDPAHEVPPRPVRATVRR